MTGQGIIGRIAHPRTRAHRPAARHRTWHAVVGGVALVAAACGQTTGGSDDGDQSNRDDDAAPTGDADLNWESCGPVEECAEIEVPLDHDAPDGATLTLSVARVPARGDRIGPLFVNPGGPGGTASDFAVRLADRLPSEVREHFDVVGVDPRGLAASPLDCGGDLTELYGVDHTIDSPEDAAVLLDASRDYVAGCEAAAGELLPHLGTRDVARDLDAVRAAMGDEQLSYLGFSYGTAIGQTLADLAPDRIRAMVLDGVVELGVAGVDFARQQALGFERALDAFLRDCDARGDCPLSPDADAAVGELFATVEEQPIAAATRPLGPGELALGMITPLYDEQRWPNLADAVADALDGDGTVLVGLADVYLGLADFDVFFAVSCLDSEWPETPEELLAAGADAGREAPRFGEAIVNDYVRCALWPAEGEPLTPVTAPDAPSILVVSTTGDPATPYEAGVRTAERLTSGVLLTHEGEGHTVVAGGVSCVDDAVARYLIDLEPPADGVVCAG